MLTCPPSVKIFLAPVGTDMRKGFDGLTEAARDVIGRDPLSGHLFVFTNRRRNRVKILFWDGSGLWVCAKRLEKGTFAWPEVEVGRSSVELRSEELALLLGGLDLRQVARRDWWRRTPPAEQAEPRMLEGGHADAVASALAASSVR